MLLLQEESLLAGGKEKYKTIHYSRKRKEKSSSEYSLELFLCIFIHRISQSLERIRFSLSITTLNPIDTQSIIHVNLSCSQAYFATFYFQNLMI
jgi:hypothetical protein